MLLSEQVKKGNSSMTDALENIQLEGKWKEQIVEIPKPRDSQYFMGRGI